jgi:hypothetical protein
MTWFFSLRATKIIQLADRALSSHLCLLPCPSHSHLDSVVTRYGTLNQRHREDTWCKSNASHRIRIKYAKPARHERHNQNKARRALP